MQAIDIKDLNFIYRNIKVFENLNLSLSDGSFTVIMGKNGSGKTALANILSNKLKFHGKILIYGKQKNFNLVETIFNDLDYYDSFDTVINILVTALKGLNKKEVRKKVLWIANEFKFNDVLNKSFNYLSFQKKVLVILGISLIKNPKILILDNIFDGFDQNLKTKVLRNLKRYSKKEKITVVYMTNDVEDALLADEILIIGDGKVLLKGSKRKVFEKEDFFEQYDMELPFVVSLSEKLKFYELIDKIYFNEKKLVDDLWK